MKNKTTALLLSIFVGGFGIDRFYLGYTGIGVLKLLTGGVFGILTLVDLIRIATGSLQPKNGQYEDTPPRTTAVTTSVDNPIEDLHKIAKLHEEGVLNDEEFEKLKTICLAKL